MYEGRLLVLAGGDLVLPDRVLSGGALVIEDGRIAAVEAGPSADVAGASVIDAGGCYVVPGFVDVHVHGVEGYDTLDSGDPIAAIAARLPRYGVTAFCPTTVACGPADLRRVLSALAPLRELPPARSARVLPAHLESNFINPEYCGAQPLSCLRLPPAGRTGAGALDFAGAGEGGSEFSAEDVLEVIAARRSDVGIVTMAPEMPGGMDLLRALVSNGHRVSLGHSGARFEQAIDAIDAGASHATHLFNRMAPMTHRAPGLAGAVLGCDDVAAELICDGHHVHPAMCRVAARAKGTDRIIAITDGTAGAGLAVGADARLGGRRIRVTEGAATLDDGTLAGSTLTMDRAFRTIVTTFGLSILDAAAMCSTTPAREMGMTGFGILVPGGAADLVVLDRAYNVVHTIIGGVVVYSRNAEVGLQKGNSMQKGEG